MEKTIAHVLLFQIERTNKMAKIYSQREFDRLGLDLTVEQWILIKIIQENSPLSQKELAEISLRDPGSITRTLDLLEKKQLVLRKAIEGNRRQYDLVITAKGQQFIEKHLPIIQLQREKSIQGIKKKELDLFIKLLKKVQSNMS